MNESICWMISCYRPFTFWCQSNGLIAKLAAYLFKSQSMTISLHKREFPIHAMTGKLWFFCLCACINQPILYHNCEILLLIHISKFKILSFNPKTSLSWICYKDINLFIFTSVISIFGAAIKTVTNTFLLFECASLIVVIYVAKTPVKHFF